MTTTSLPGAALHACADPEGLDALARTLWGEARGEPVDGIEAVANVILNRVGEARAYRDRHPGKTRHPLFGDGTVAGACLANPGARYRQFSCWNGDDPNCAKAKAVTSADADFRRCLDIAQRAIAGQLTDRTGGATHYYDCRIPAPSWTRGARLTTAIGHHRFYADVP